MNTGLIKDKKFFTARVWMAILAVSIAGSVAWQPPYFYSGFYDAFMEAFHMNHSQIGLYIAVYGWGNLLSYVPGGIIADYYGPRKLLLVSLFGTALITLAMAIWMTPFCAILTSFLFSITTCLLLWSTLTKAVRVIGGSDHCATVYSLYSGISGVIGFCFGMVQIWVFNLCHDNTSGIYWALITLAASCFIAGVLVAFFYRDDPNELEHAEKEEKMNLRDVPKIAKNPILWATSVLMALFLAAFGTISYFVPYLTSIVGLTVTQGAIFNSVISYGVSFVVPIGGFLIDRYLKSTFKLFIIGLVLIMMMMFVILYVPMGAATAIVVCTLTYTVGAILSAAMWAILDEIHIPMKYAATGIGLASMVAYAPDLFLYNIYGNWLDSMGEATGYRMMWFATIGICLVALVLSFILLKAIQKQPSAETTVS